jgi:hypothetical protein
MKKLSLIAAAIVLASSSAFAATVTDSFNVAVTFTGACTVKTAAADIAFTYAAFGAAQSTSTSTVFECSRGLTPTFKFDDTSTSQTGSAAAALGTDITGEGVTTGSAASAGTGGTGGSDGSADQYTVSITADIAGNQAGTGASGSGTHIRVLTISY